MEPNNKTADGASEHLFDLQVDQQSISYLGEIARWAKFLSIVGFVVCGVMIIFALFAGSILSFSPAWVIQMRSPALWGWAAPSFPLFI